MTTTTESIWGITSRLVYGWRVSPPSSTEHTSARWREAASCRAQKGHRNQNTQFSLLLPISRLAICRNPIVRGGRMIWGTRLLSWRDNH